MKKLRGEKDIEATLQRLDRLTLDEVRATAAQTLEVVYDLAQNRRVVMDGEKTLPALLFARCWMFIWLESEGNESAASISDALGMSQLAGNKGAQCLTR